MQGCETPNAAVQRCLDSRTTKFEVSKSGVPAKVALRICTTEIGKEEPATEPLNASPNVPKSCVQVLREWACSA